MKRNTEALVDANIGNDPKMYAEGIKYMFNFQQDNVGQNHN
jgi:hypothetical protein